MHGKVKVRTTAEQEKIKQAERQKKAGEFRKAVELLFQKRKNKEYDDELLLITEKLLAKYPDVYTLWNIRREGFNHNKWTNEELIEKLEKELTLIEICLRENPKSYYAWHQRTRIIQQLPNPNWKRELDLCTKCLSLDERNFHCWSYRQFVVNKANIPDIDELEFTTSKILNNFSNYSSWHYRSKILKKLYPSETHDLPIRADKHDEELDLVMNATFTDPNDSSSWFYHRWLIGYCKLPHKLWQVVLNKNIVTVAFHKEVASNLELLVNNTELECKWKSVNGKKFSTVWYAEFGKPLNDNLKEVLLKFEDNIYELKQSSSLDKWIFKSEILSKNHNDSKLKEQLENYETLSHMEPLNKWAKLTSVHLMMIIYTAEKHSNIMKGLDDLIKIDPLRTNYYKDMRSKYVLTHKLHLTEIENEENNMTDSVNLSNLELTSLSSQEVYLSFYHEIDFSNNCLGNQLYQLNTLQNCITINLTNNGISSLNTFPTLKSLKVLILSDNQITNSKEIFNILERHNLKKIDLKGNLFSETDLLVNEIKNSFPNVEVVV